MSITNTKISSVIPTRAAASRAWTRTAILSAAQRNASAHQIDPKRMRGNPAWNEGRNTRRGGEMLGTKNGHGNRKKQSAKRHDLVDAMFLRQFIENFDEADDEKQRGTNIDPECRRRHAKRRASSERYDDSELLETAHEDLQRWALRCVTSSGNILKARNADNKAPKDGGGVDPRGRLQSCGSRCARCSIVRSKRRSRVAIEQSARRADRRRRAVLRRAEGCRDREDHPHGLYRRSSWLAMNAWNSPQFIAAMRAISRRKISVRPFAPRTMPAQEYPLTVETQDGQPSQRIRTAMADGPDFLCVRSAAADTAVVPAGCRCCTTREPASRLARGARRQTVASRIS